jgi:hypothetical protein
MDCMIKLAFDKKKVLYAGNRQRLILDQDVITIPKGGREQGVTKCMASSRNCDDENLHQT